MTDKEKAIVMAYTGICMLTDDKFQIFHKYVEDIMGRPIMTHEMGLLSDTIKEKARPDFMALCADESGSENPSRWIPADANNLPKGKVIYKLYDGRMGIGVLYNYEFFSDDELTVCVRDDYGDHPNVIEWTPLPISVNGGQVNGTSN